MSSRATRKGATVARRASKSPARSRASKPQVHVAPDPSLPLVNPQHERFACEYIKDFNGTQAYLRTADGVGVASAGTMGARLLGKVDVRARIEHLAREVLGEAKQDGQKVLLGMARAAYFDVRKAFDEKGALLPIHQLPDEVAFAVAGLEVVEKALVEVGVGPDGEPVEKIVPLYVKKVKFNDRIAALGNLGKHFKLFTEKVELGGPGGGPVKIQQEESPETRAARAAFEKRLAAVESAVSR